MFRPGSGENTLLCEQDHTELLSHGPDRSGSGSGLVLVCDVMSTVGSVPGQFDDAEEDR